LALLELAIPTGPLRRGLAGLVEALESILGRTIPRDSRQRSLVLAEDNEQARKHREGSGQAGLWVERNASPGAIGGVVRIHGDSGEIRSFPFQAMRCSRFWRHRASFESAAARRIVDLLDRSPEAPWPGLEETSASSNVPALSSLWSRAEWGIGYFDPQGAMQAIHRRRGVTLADPFPLVHEGREWLFFEEQKSGEPGAIGAGLVGREGLTEMITVAGIGSSHRSWPNAFHHRGELWMLPESGADGEVALWRCTDFPGRWEKERVLLWGAAWTDPVLFEEAGDWWLFVSGSGPSPESHSDSLHLFHSPDPWRVEFRPHPWNPVAVGVVGSRPAGRLFREGGRLVRPAQDCSGRYGRALVFRSIERLSRTEFVESALRRIDPPAGYVGIHTWNQGLSGTFVDLLTAVPRWN
jgi:hypothetical protein